MRKKIMLLCLGIILVCLVILATDGQLLPQRRKPEAAGLRVALSQSESLTPWKTAQINSFKEAAAGRGLELIYHSPEAETLSWQLQDIRELFEEGLDYLILIPRIGVHFNDPSLSMEEVAADAGLSPGRFSTLFKNETETTFTEYLLKARMEKAKELMRNPSRKIYEVAMEAGYDNIPYFSTAFKKYTGCSPSEYRNLKKD